MKHGRAGILLMGAMAAMTVCAGDAGATSVSFEPDEKFLEEAPYVTEAVITDSVIKREKCLYQNTLTMTLTDPLRGVRPTSKPVVLVVTDYPYDKGCMGISYSTPPRASKLEKGARIIAAIACTERDKCNVRATWDATERPRLEKELAKAGRADGHEAKCGAAAAGARAKKAVEDVSIAKGVVTPPTKAGITATWTGAAHKIDGPGVLELSLARAGKTLKLRSLSDEYSGWKRAEEIGVCWRVIDAEDFDPEAAVIQVFVLR